MWTSWTDSSALIVRTVSVDVKQYSVSERRRSTVTSETDVTDDLESRLNNQPSACAWLHHVNVISTVSVQLRSRDKDV